jgi:hypothetical protein
MAEPSRLPIDLGAYARLEDHAVALGYVCIVHAQLEDALNRFLEILLGCGNQVRRAVVDATGASLANRCGLIRKVAACEKFDGTWLDEVNAIMSLVVDDISPRRNRLVHDVWIPARPDVLQIDQRLPVKGSKDTEIDTVIRGVRAARTAEEMWALVQTMDEVPNKLTRLSAHLIHRRRHLQLAKQLGLHPESLEMPPDPYPYT